MVDPAYIKPIKPCCGQSHPGVVCNDGRVMCCLCFKKFDIDQLQRTAAGEVEDVCQSCGAYESARLAEIESGAGGSAAHPPLARGPSTGRASEGFPTAPDSPPKCICPEFDEFLNEGVPLSKLAEQGERCPVHGIPPYREVDDLG